MIDILFRIVRFARQYGGIEHAHQAGEAFFVAIVRRGGEQDQGV